MYKNLIIKKLGQIVIPKITKIYKFIIKYEKEVMLWNMNDK